MQIKWENKEGKNVQMARVIAHNDSEHIAKLGLMKFPVEAQYWFNQISKEFLMAILGTEEEMLQMMTGDADKDGSVTGFLVVIPPTTTTEVNLLPILKPIAKSFPTKHWFLGVSENDLTSLSPQCFKSITDAEDLQHPKVQLLFFDLTIADCNTIVPMVKTFKAAFGKALKSSSIFLVCILMTR
jgi:hypothetical protein